MLTGKINIFLCNPTNKNLTNCFDSSNNNFSFVSTVSSWAAWCWVAGAGEEKVGKLVYMTNETNQWLTH